MRQLLSKIVFRIIECEKTMLLLSRAMDDRLGLVHRSAIRLHCLCCPGCTNYRVQLPFLRSAVRRVADNASPERVATFSSADKERLKSLLRAAADE